MESPAERNNRTNQEKQIKSMTCLFVILILLLIGNCFQFGVIVAILAG